MGRWRRQRRKNERHYVCSDGAIINSMTPSERRYHNGINGSRKKRIAGGSGTQLQDVNRLLKQHKQMQKMMKKLGKKGGMANMMRGMGGMQAPPGLHAVSDLAKNLVS